MVPFTNQILSNTPDEVKHIKIWTDGPASQFKNQYVMASMPMLSPKHNVKFMEHDGTSVQQAMAKDPLME